MVTRAPMPEATRAALMPTIPPPRTTTWAGATPGTPLTSSAESAGRVAQVVRADQRRHAPGDLAHGREQGEAAAGQLHGLVGHADDPAVHSASVSSLSAAKCK